MFRNGCKSDVTQISSAGDVTSRSRMLKHVEQRALALGCRGLVLQVNKQNGGSLAFYGKAGFTVREEAVFDIGQGYVMDDYVMEKRLT